jgi:hypothetical protein
MFYDNYILLLYAQQQLEKVFFHGRTTTNDVVQQIYH